MFIEVACRGGGGKNFEKINAVRFGKHRNGTASFSNWNSVLWLSRHYG
jgi:hypothetical protein